MIKDSDTWEEWEKEYKRKEEVNFFKNLEIFEALYEEARALGKLPPEDPLEGIEIKIKLARILNDTKGS